MERWWITQTHGQENHQRKGKRAEFQNLKSMQQLFRIMQQNSLGMKTLKQSIQNAQTEWSHSNDPMSYTNFLKLN